MLPEMNYIFSDHRFQHRTMDVSVLRQPEQFRLAVSMKSMATFRAPLVMLLASADKQYSFPQTHLSRIIAQESSS
jgi:hypothetical protein